MDVLKILKKSIDLVWHYRATWLFGFLLALTTSNALWFGVSRNDEQLTDNRIILPNSNIIYFPGEGVTIDVRAPDSPSIDIEGLEQGWYRDLSEELNLGDLSALLISIGVLIVMSIILTILLRFTSQAALIKMVDGYERTGKKISLRQALRLGWSKIASRLFLIDLVIKLPVFLIFCLLFLIAISPFFLFMWESMPENAPSVVGIILLSLILLLLFVFLAIVTAALMSILLPVMHQACVVDDLTVKSSIQKGWQLFRKRFKEVGITWFVVFAARVIWTIAVIPIFFLLLPVILLSIIASLLICAIVTSLIFLIANLFVSTISAWVIGIIFALPLFTTITLSPVIFLSGLVEVFKTSFWTLSYREFRMMAEDFAEPVDETENVEEDSIHAE